MLEKRDIYILVIIGDWERHCREATVEEVCPSYRYRIAQNALFVKDQDGCKQEMIIYLLSCDAGSVSPMISRELICKKEMKTDQTHIETQKDASIRESSMLYRKDFGNAICP